MEKPTDLHGNCSYSYFHCIVSRIEFWRIKYHYNLSYIFYYSNKILIKRIIAVPGDYIWIESDGTVFLNGEPLEEPYVSEKALGECDIDFPYQVPENNYFMMGDHRETSIDSRSSVIGCIAEDQIVGKIFCKFWPLSEFEFIK